MILFKILREKLEDGVLLNDYPFRYTVSGPQEIDNPSTDGNQLTAGILIQSSTQEFPWKSFYSEARLYDLQNNDHRGQDYMTASSYRFPLFTDMGKLDIDYIGCYPPRKDELDRNRQCIHSVSTSFETKKYKQYNDLIKFAGFLFHFGRVNNIEIGFNIQFTFNTDDAASEFINFAQSKKIDLISSGHGVVTVSRQQLQNLAGEVIALSLVQLNTLSNNTTQTHSTQQCLIPRQQYSHYCHPTEQQTLPSERQPSLSEQQHQQKSPSDEIEIKVGQYIKQANIKTCGCEKTHISFKTE